VKPEYVLVAVVTACLTVMSISPALAAQREIEDFCFDRLQHLIAFALQFSADYGTGH